MTYDGVARATKGHVVSVSGGTVRPPAPTSFIVTVVSNSRVDLSWVNGSGGSIQVERSLDGLTLWTILGNTIDGATSYSDTTVHCEITYFYRVSAIVSDIMSEYTAVEQADVSACEATVIVEFRSHIP